MFTLRLQFLTTRCHNFSSQISINSFRSSGARRVNHTDTQLAKISPQKYTILESNSSQVPSKWKMIINLNFNCNLATKYLPIIHILKLFFPNFRLMWYTSVGSTQPPSYACICHIYKLRRGKVADTGSTASLCLPSPCYCSKEV